MQDGNGDGDGADADDSVANINQRIINANNFQHAWMRYQSTDNASAAITSEDTNNIAIVPNAYIHMYIYYMHTEHPSLGHLTHN